MYSSTVIGVDPGIVHTGVVVLDFNEHDRVLTVGHAVVDGLDAPRARAEAQALAPRPLALCDTFIEWYRPRSGFSVDERMVQANATFRLELGGKLLRNTGVKKVVTPDLMKLLHVWSFSTTTHHQDLRSAARIALLGMLLSEPLNQVLYRFTTNHLDGKAWDVRAV